VLIEIVTESETCDIYKAVLLTVKEAARDVSRAPIDRTSQRTKQSIA
jgi:tRNA threonylcarbamoyladenosine modification (KEOPS) complex  Pcc1 subunit